MSIANNPLKLVMSAGVISLVTIVSVSSAFAGPEPTVAQVGNELHMQFNITNPVYENIVNLRWSDGGQALKSFDAKRGIARTVNYKVSEGADFTDYEELEPQKVDILLKIGSDPSMIGKVVADANELMSYSEGGVTYYLLHDGLEIFGGITELSGDFDIVFNALTNGTPFEASIIAVADELTQQEAPIFNFNPMTITFTSVDLYDTNYANNSDWHAKVSVSSSFYYSLDGGTTYLPISAGYVVNNGQGVFAISGPGANFVAAQSETIRYKIVVPGYEDVNLVAFNSA